MAFIRKKREEPKVDLTSMVDVVFLLLLFFMISTTFVETPGLDINLPETGSRVTEKKPEELRVYLSRDGQISIRDERVSLAEFKERLAELGAKAPTMTFLLLADRDSRHGRVVQLMDLARDAGFRKLAIAAESRPPSPENRTQKP